MPTGYTNAIISDEGVSFKEFLTRCSRAMGAFIMQRDDPMDVPPARSFEPSTYYRDKYQEAQSAYIAAQSMTTQDWENDRESRVKTMRVEAERSMQRDAESKRRYESMLEKCEAWEPPTPDHQGLKDFMISQINETIKFDCLSDWPQSQMATADFMEQQPIGQYIEDRLTSLAKDRAYREKSWQEEQGRTAGRNAFAEALWKSIDSME